MILSFYNGLLNKCLNVLLLILMRKTPNMIIYRVQFFNQDTNLTGDKTAIPQQKNLKNSEILLVFHLYKIVILFFSRKISKPQR